MNGRILAVDTTGVAAGIALIEDGRIVEEILLESPDGFAHVLFGAISDLLAKYSLGLRDIDVFASASGPGSFTGVRVGLTAIKGLAEATGRKAAAVSNLQALASFGTRPLRAVVLDARRGEIFGAVYDANLRIICGEVVAKFETWIAALPSEELEFITTDYHAAFPGPVIRAPKALAGAIGIIVARQIVHPQDTAAIDANYVRRSDAELHWSGER